MNKMKNSEKYNIAKWLKDLYHKLFSRKKEPLEKPAIHPGSKIQDIEKKLDQVEQDVKKLIRHIRHIKSDFANQFVPISHEKQLLNKIDALEKRIQSLEGDLEKIRSWNPAVFSPKEGNAVMSQEYSVELESYAALPDPVYTDEEGINND